MSADLAPYRQAACNCQRTYRNHRCVKSRAHPFPKLTFFPAFHRFLSSALTPMLLCRLPYQTEVLYVFLVPSRPRSFGLGVVSSTLGTDRTFSTIISHAKPFERYHLFASFFFSGQKTICNNAKWLELWLKYGGEINSQQILLTE